MNVTIKQTWDGRKPANNSEITIELIPNVDFDNKKNLLIIVNSPFYNDPEIPKGTPNGTMDKLWNYEVAEVFLLGADDHYLEIELGPKGQYLLLLLHGHNVVKYPLPLKHYRAKIIGNRWTGEAYIPNEYIPEHTTKFNAYAIYGSDPKREYLALFPTPYGKYEYPDFHRLEYFGPLNITVK